LENCVDGAGLTVSPRRGVWESDARLYVSQKENAASGMVIGGEKKAREERQEGIVEEALPGLTFRVRLLGSGEEVLAHLAGRLKLHHIRVLLGDRVLLERSPDGRRGRIVRRL